MIVSHNNSYPSLRLWIGLGALVGCAISFVGFVSAPGQSQLGMHRARVTYGVRSDLDQRCLNPQYEDGCTWLHD